MKYTIDYIRKNNLILYEVISGSHAYGTNIATSDVDIRGVFVVEPEDLQGLRSNYVEQVSDDKNDIVFYELSRYVELLITNNANMLEMLNVPDDCVIHRHELMNLITSDLILSKKCKMAFSGYAYDQIKKARGLKKKVVNPIDKKRKNPIDFCHAFNGVESIPLLEFLEKEGLDQKLCGVSQVLHGKDLYALFYDVQAHDCFSEMVKESVRNAAIFLRKEAGLPMGFGFNGISFEDSNSIRLSAIPKGIKSLVNFFYNKDGYACHCKEYKEYWDWNEKKNLDRFKNSVESGYDCKNMMHCVRLLNTAGDIARDHKVVVRRPEREYLLSIRNGECSYEDLIAYSEKKIAENDALFENTTLPDSPNIEKLNSIIIEIRRKIYG